MSRTWRDFFIKTKKWKNWCIKNTGWKAMYFNWHLDIKVTRKMIIDIWTYKQRSKNAWGNIMILKQGNYE